MWQVTRSTLVNPPFSRHAQLLLWHGIFSPTSIRTLPGTRTGSHCFWCPASPRNNRLSLPWFCKLFAKRLKLAGQTKGRLSTASPPTPTLPIKSVVTTNTWPVSFSFCFVLTNLNGCVLSHLLHIDSVIPQRSNGFAPQRVTSALLRHALLPIDLMASGCGSFMSEWPPFSVFCKALRRHEAVKQEKTFLSLVCSWLTSMAFVRPGVCKGPCDVKFIIWLWTQGSIWTSACLPVCAGAAL